MLTSLDPHSSYFNQEAADDMRTQTRGEFGGLGIEVTMEDELVKVITPIDETPAARAGVLWPVTLFPKSTASRFAACPFGEAVDKMRGPVNTAIELTILREGADQPIKIKVVRDIIAVKAVRLPGRGRCRLSAGDLVHRENV
jgi:carboxyl-terminal processing protease